MAVQDSPSSRDPEDARAAAARRVNTSGWNWLLVIPFIGVLIPAFYNKEDPSIGGMPFFYWYQMLWIAISVVITVVVYRATRGRR